MKIKKCPYCKNNIRLHEIKFPYVNDYGGIVVKCSECDKVSFSNVKNPAESSISLGGIKIDTWDREVIKNEDFLLEYPDILEMDAGVLVIGDYKAREYNFDFSAANIYYCKSCKKEVETTSKDCLDINSETISSSYKNLMNFILANDGWARDNLVIEVNCECACGQKFTSFWHQNYILDGNPLDYDKLFLIGTDMPLSSNDIDGIMSKNNCIKTLEKFIIRWNAIFSRLLIVTPFIGHQWMSQIEVIELWDWIKNYVDPNKSTLVTRTATFNKYKKACEEKGISLELLEDFGISNALITEFTRKQDFHAKIYVGYSKSNSEILLGSFNLMNGPSMENISLKHSDYHQFLNKFISPMNINISEPNEIEKNWSHIYQDENNEWKTDDIKSEKILSRLLNY